MLSPTRRYLSVTIPTAADGLSAAVDLEDEVLVGVQILGAWTAADLNFQASFDFGSTFGALYDEAGNLVTIVNTNIAANRPISLNSSMGPLFAGVRRLKLKSSAQQAAVRTVWLVARQL